MGLRASRCDASISSREDVGPQRSARDLHDKINVRTARVLQEFLNGVPRSTLASTILVDDDSDDVVHNFSKVRARDAAVDSLLHKSLRAADERVIASVVSF